MQAVSLRGSGLKGGTSKSVDLPIVAGLGGRNFIVISIVGMLIATAKISQGLISFASSFLYYLGARTCALQTLQSHHDKHHNRLPQWTHFHRKRRRHISS